MNTTPTLAVRVLERSEDNGRTWQLLRRIPREEYLGYLLSNLRAQARSFGLRRILYRVRLPSD